MSNSYRFSNLLGATYQGGSVQFTPDGNTLLSPVGNRVSLYDLVQGRCFALAPENRQDIACLALSPDARLLLSVDRAGHALLINFVRGAVLHRINFKGVVHSAKWSPDSAYLAVARGRYVQLWRAPTVELGWQFVQHRTFGGHMDDIIDLAWAPDSFFLTSCSKDMSVRLWSLGTAEGFEPMSLVEHRSHVRAAFFSADMHYLYSLSRDGVLVSLRYDLKVDEAQEKNHAGTARSGTPLYCRPGEWTVAGKAYCQQPVHQRVTRCAFDAKSNLLAAGFSNGIFMLYEVPGLAALQTLSLGSQPLDAVALGANGDWLAVGSAALGQLLVWEWRSETYVLKQQGHHWGVRCAAFSPSGTAQMWRQKGLPGQQGRPDSQGGTSVLAGRLLATGGYDGKVKLFNSQSGLCFVTFAEHTAPISAICFTPQGNAILSASEDGSVRAFDLLRYRNFRTFASPDGLCQFSSVAVDSGGEIVAASSKGGKYAIYVWSIQTGNVLEVLAAHTSHVQSIHFSPSPSNPGQLVSASWDSTLRVWDLYGKARAEPLDCPSSVLCVVFDPRANDVCAAACLTGQVLFWNVSNGTNIGSIEGLRDIQSGRQWGQQYASSHTRGAKLGKGLKAGNSSEGVNLNQHFSSIAYARSGELLLCASRSSPHVVLYDTTSYTLAARLTLTSNQSLSGVQTFLNSKNMTEASVPLQTLDVSDSDEENEAVSRQQARIRQATSLPGVDVGEAKDAYSERELHVWGVAFSADSQTFAAATSHGVFVYAADMGCSTPGAAASIYGGDVGRFVPQMLTKAVSAPAVVKALDAGDLCRAMILALALNDYGLLRRVYEAVPTREIPVIIASVGAPLLPALLWFLSLELRPSSGTAHFQFHLKWVASVIDLHLLTLLEMSSGRSTSRTGSALEAAAASKSDVAAMCLQLLVELSQRYGAMSKTFDSNIYMLRYLSNSPAGQAPGDEEEPADAEAAGVAAPPPPRPSLFEQLMNDKKEALAAGAGARAAPLEGAASGATRKKKRKNAGAGAEAAAAEACTPAGPAGKRPRRPGKRAAAAGGGGLPG
mmetsp:Transcript_27037/g.72050  ORF Transcript_27037/g.72050 Transcript_27037/m.72050 type:complete len:1056 (-) Transcript_27037:37-3204(-)